MNFYNLRSQTFAKKGRKNVKCKINPFYLHYIAFFSVDSSNENKNRTWKSLMVQAKHYH